MPFLTLKLDENGVPVLAKAAQSIAKIESEGSGGYAAVGPRTKSGDRAYGKYQVMGANIPSWTQKHLGKSMTPQQFLADQAAQDAVFRGEFGEYSKKYGLSDAASMWFSGKPLAQAKGRSDGYTKVEDYVSRFNAGMGAPVGSPSVPDSFSGGKFGLPKPTSLAQPAGDVIDLSDFVKNPDLLADQLSKRGLSGGFGGFGSKLRDQNAINRDLIARGERPDSVVAAPPRTAEIRRFEGAQAVKTREAAEAAQAAGVRTATPNAWMYTGEGARLDIGSRIAAAVKANPSYGKIAKKWMDNISASMEKGDVRAAEALIKSLATNLELGGF